MKLSKGQRRTLRLMHINPSTVPEQALRDFFAYTDRGIRPPYLQKGCIWPQNEVSLAWNALQWKFKMLAQRESWDKEKGDWDEFSWAYGLKYGFLSPWDFNEYEWGDWEEAKRIDIRVCGYERAIWNEIRGC